VRHAIEQLLPVVNASKAPPANNIPVFQANMGAPQQQVLEIRIAVPDNRIGRVIGRGGETIKRISDESGARLQIERESNEVSAKGDASQLEIARMLIHDIVTAPVRQAPAPGAGAGTSGEGKPEYVVIEIDSQGQEGRIIGRGGENIRSMAMTSGAKIQIDKETKMIKISGFKDKVETAKHMLEAFMADYVPRDQQQYQ
jgi:far upstream element-binding protein